MMQSWSVGIVNKVNMVVRNTRPRYPIPSEQVSDTYDEIYYTIVDLLGYQNEEGVVTVSGELRELWDDLDTRRGVSFGSSVSGVLEAYVQASGASDYSLINNINYKTMAMANNAL